MQCFSSGDLPILPKILCLTRAVEIMKRTILFLAIVVIFCGLSLGPIYGSGTTIIDSYPESNWDGAMGVGYVNPAGGQSIIGDGRPLNSVRLYCCKWPGAT